MSEKLVTINSPLRLRGDRTSFDLVCDVNYECLDCLMPINCGFNEKDSAMNIFENSLYYSFC